MEPFLQLLDLRATVAYRLRSIPTPRIGEFALVDPSGTFITPDGTFIISRTVTGFFTPAHG